MAIRRMIYPDDSGEPQEQPGQAAAKQALACAVEAFVALDELRAGDRGCLYHLAVSGVHDLCAHVVQCEQAGCRRAEVLDVLAPARDIHARSPFVARLQDWPRGYPGDFETIEYLCDALNRAQQGTIEHCIEAYALNSAAAQQHRNKVRHQASWILDTFLSRPAPRVLSLACGSCCDVRLIQRYMTNRAGQLVLNDLDASALDAAKTALQPIAPLCRFVHGNALKVARKMEASGEFDLVIAGGLFDYLSDNQASYLIANVYASLLRPGGTFFFTNMGKGNPYRPWIEYLSDWMLIERSEDEILDLCRTSGVEAERVGLTREETGLTILAELTRVG